jgi:hypothetical protein
MRLAIFLLWMLLSATSAMGQVSVGIGLPGISIGINIPVYPEFVRVPNYPVYYAPRLSANLFFYDGVYWVYQGDNWYMSAWYNGPWSLVAPHVVPVYVLRIPVRYYRSPPPYFRGWRPDAPPRWGEHWGPEWDRQRSGWDKWKRSAAPRPAPLPRYQRTYSGDRYPQQAEQQQALHSRNYRYQPRDEVVRQHSPVPPPQDAQRSARPSQPPQRAREDVRRPAVSPAAQREQKAPRQGAKNDGKDDKRGPDRNK